MCYVIIKDKMRMGIYHNINIWIDGKIIELKPKSEIKINKKNIKNNVLYFSTTYFKSKKLILNLSENKNTEIEIINNMKPLFSIIIVNMFIISILILLKISIFYLIVLYMIFIILQNFLILFFGIGIEVKEIK